MALLLLLLLCLIHPPLPPPPCLLLVQVGDNSARYGGLSQDAIFIQALNPTRDTHCRLVIPNHTYQKYSYSSVS